MAKQRFQLITNASGLPPDMGCAGCQAVPTEVTPEAGDGPAMAIEMDHAKGCPEVSKLAAGSQ